MQNQTGKIRKGAVNQTGHADPRTSKQVNLGPGQDGHGIKGTGESGQRESTQQHVHFGNDADGNGQGASAPRDEPKDKSQRSPGRSGQGVNAHNNDGKNADKHHAAGRDRSRDQIGDLTPGQIVHVSDEDGQPTQASPNSSGRGDGEYEAVKTTKAIFPPHP